MTKKYTKEPVGQKRHTDEVDIEQGDIHIENDGEFLQIFIDPEKPMSDLDCESIEMLFDKFGSEPSLSSEKIAKKYTKAELASLLLSLAREHVPIFQFTNQGAPGLDEATIMRRMIFAYGLLGLVEKGLAKNKKDACRMLSKSGSIAGFDGLDDNGDVLYDRFKNIIRQDYFMIWESVRDNTSYADMQKRIAAYYNSKLKKE